MTIYTQYVVDNSGKNPILSDANGKIVIGFSEQEIDMFRGIEDGMVVYLSWANSSDDSMYIHEVKPDFS